MSKSFFPEPLSQALCGGDLRKRLMRQMRDITQLSSRRDVLLSTDRDEQAVTAYLALSPAVHLAGIVSSFDPRKVLSTLPGRKQPPVVAGSTHPLEEMETADYAGADFIIHESQAYDSNNRLVVVLIGAATNVAAALLRDPTLEDRIEVVASAFDSWPQGTDALDVSNDVWAWQILMESATPVTVGCNDACKHLSRGQAPGALQGKISNDLVVVAYLMGHTRSVLYPRPILQDDAGFAHHSARPVPLPESSDEPKIRWITWLDANAFWADASKLLGDA